MDSSFSMRSLDDEPLSSFYSVAIRTSNIQNAETLAEVFVQMEDVDGYMSDKVKLKTSLTHKFKYQRGHSDLFLLLDQPSLNRIKQVHITHVKLAYADDTDRAWHVHSIMIISHERNELYHINVHSWIGNNDEETYDATFPVTSEPWTVLPPTADDLF